MLKQSIFHHFCVVIYSNNRVKKIKKDKKIEIN